MIYIEILLGLLLYISTVGYMQTFRGQSFFNFVIASIIMVFNYFALKSVLAEWDINQFIWIVSSISIVLFFIYKLFFGDEDIDDEHKHISPSIILVIVFLVSAYLYAMGGISIISSGSKMNISNIPTKHWSEATTTYNNKLQSIDFVVGRVVLKNYNPDTNIANIELMWSDEARDKLSAIPTKSSISLSISNQDVKEIFDNIQADRELYSKIVYNKSSFTITDIFLIYKDRKIAIDTTLKAPNISNISNTTNITNITTKWNPLIYKGKRSYTKESEDSIKDNYTGLIWQKQTSSKEMKWDEAKAYCKAQTTDNQKWRLPTYNELYYLADRSKYNPAIDKSYFDMPNDDYPWFWSNTEYANDKTQAWVVSFSNGNDGWGSKTDSNFVRCVR